MKLYGAIIKLHIIYNRPKNKVEGNRTVTKYWKLVYYNSSFSSNKPSMYAPCRNMLVYSKGENYHLFSELAELL